MADEQLSPEEASNIEMDAPEAAPAPQEGDYGPLPAEAQAATSGADSEGRDTQPAAGDQVDLGTNAGIKKAAAAGLRGQRRPGAQAADSATAQRLRNADPIAMAQAEMEAVDAHSQREKAAQAQISDITRRKADEEADLLDKQEAFTRQVAAQEEAAHATAAAEVSRHMRAYEQQMAAVRAMSVDPTGPIGSMSVGQAAGMSLAMFAQGFLGARGIHIDVGGQIDKWVERSIHEQERRIQQAEAGAKDQLTLLEVARETSRDDAEARLRYKGMILEAMGTSLKASAARFGSQLAVADAQLANAKIDAAADSTKRTIAQNAFKAVKDAAMADSQIALNRAHAAYFGAETYKLQHPDAPKQGKDENYYVKDLRDEKLIHGSDGKLYAPVVSKLPKDMPPQKRDDVVQVESALPQVQAEFKDLQSIRRQALAEGLGGSDFMKGAAAKMGPRASELRRRYEAGKARIQAFMLREEFKRATGLEWESLAPQLAFDKVVQAGNQDDILEDTRRHVDQKMRAVFETAPGLDPDDHPPGAVQIKDPTSGRPMWVEEVRDPSAIVERKANSVALRRGAVAAEANGSAQQSLISDETRAATKDEGRAPEASPLWRTAYGGSEEARAQNAAQPAAARHLDLLAYVAVDPAETQRRYQSAHGTKAALPDDPAAASQDAMAALESVARSKEVGGATRMYARRLLVMLRDAPEAVRAAMDNTATSGLNEDAMREGVDALFPDEDEKK